MSTNSRDFITTLAKLCGPKTKKKPVAKDEIVPVHAARQQQLAALLKANPYHDDLGRFTTGSGGSRGRAAGPIPEGPSDEDMNPKSTTNQREKGLLGEKPTSTKEERLARANTIMDQLGGRQFRVMTGAKDFVATDSGVRFQLPRNNGINRVEVKLTGKDLYDVEYGQMHGGKYTTKAKSNDLYADQLRGDFERNTKLRTSLKQVFKYNPYHDKDGKFTSEANNSTGKGGEGEGGAGGGKSSGGGKGPQWEYEDARGVKQRGTVESVSDKGGSDVTYMFRNTNGGLDVVSGSRLKNAKVLPGDSSDYDKKDTNPETSRERLEGESDEQYNARRMAQAIREQNSGMSWDDAKATEQAQYDKAKAKVERHSDAIPMSDKELAQHQKDLESDNWHTRTMARMKDMPDDALKYTRQDALDTIKANPNGKKAGQYADEASYASMELKRRQDHRNKFEFPKIDMPKKMTVQAMQISFEKAGYKLTPLGYSLTAGHARYRVTSPDGKVKEMTDKELISGVKAKAKG